MQHQFSAWYYCHPQSDDLGNRYVEISNASCYLSAFKFSDICYCSQIKFFYVQFCNFTFHQLYFNNLPSIFSLGWVGSSCRRVVLMTGVPNIYLSVLPWARAGEFMRCHKWFSASSPGSRDVVITSVPRSWWFLCSCWGEQGAPCAAFAAVLPPRSTSELRWQGTICCWNIKCHLVAKSQFLNFHQPLHPKLAVPPSRALSLDLDFHSMQIFVKGKWFLSPKSFSHLGDGHCAKLINVMQNQQLLHFKMFQQLRKKPTTQEKSLSNRKLKAVERNCQTTINWKPYMLQISSGALK